MAINQVSGANVVLYDPRGHDFVSWADLMCELFASNGLEVPNAMTDWRLWGDSLKAIDIFMSQGSPQTSAFDDWQSWASALVGAFNERPQ